jgi:hypothetical protein
VQGTHVTGDDGEEDAGGWGKTLAALPKLGCAERFQGACSSTGAPVPQPARAKRLVYHVTLARQLQAGKEEKGKMASSAGKWG